MSVKYKSKMWYKRKKMIIKLNLKNVVHINTYDANIKKTITLECYGNFSEEFFKLITYETGYKRLKG